MNNILTQNDGNNQLGIGSTQINILGITGNTLDITQGTTSFMSISNSSSSEKISVKKPTTLTNNLLTIKSTAKIDSATTNSLFYIDDNSELKTLGIGTTDEYLRMGFNRPAWGPKTFVETNITENSIGSIGYLEELKIDDNKLIGIGSTLGYNTKDDVGKIITYDTNKHTSLIMSNGVGVGTLTIKTKYDTNFFDITLKKIDSDFSSNAISKSLEIVDAKTYKYTIDDLSNNSIHYYKLDISDINSFTTSTKKFHHITLRRDSTAPGNISFTISYYKRSGGVSVGIQDSDSVSNEVWLAPTGTTSFSAGSTMTKTTNGTSTSILTPTSTGSYYLHIKDAAGNINEISQALQVVLPTQNSGSYPGYMKNLYLDNNPSGKSILSSNNAGSNINIQRSSNKTYYSNVPRNSVGSIGFSMNSTDEFYLTLSQDVSPLEFTISIHKYSNGGFGSTTGNGSAATNSPLTPPFPSNEKIITSSNSFTNNDTNYYKIMINSTGSLAASTYIEHYVALCRGERPHFMHYLNPFFNTSRPVYIKLLAWKLGHDGVTTFTDTVGDDYDVNLITPPAYGKWGNGWLYSYGDPYGGTSSSQGCMVNTYMNQNDSNGRWNSSSYYNYGAGLGTVCQHTNNKKWKGHKNYAGEGDYPNTLSNYSGTNRFNSSQTLSSSTNNHDSFTKNSNCIATYKVTYKPTSDPDSTYNGLSTHGYYYDPNNKNYGNAGRFKYHIYNHRCQDFTDAGSGGGKFSTQYGEIGDISATYRTPFINNGHFATSESAHWDWLDGNSLINKNDTVRRWTSNASHYSAYGESLSSGQSNGTLGVRATNLRKIEITGIRNSTTLFGRIYGLYGCTGNSSSQAAKQTALCWGDDLGNTSYGINHSAGYSYVNFKQKTTSSLPSSPSDNDMMAHRVWQICICEEPKNDNSDTTNNSTSLGSSY
jgi:hypothetical protein